MNKSLEFVKKRLKEMGMNWDYKDEEMDIHSPESLFRQALKNSAIVDFSSEDAISPPFSPRLYRGGGSLKL